GRDSSLVFFFLGDIIVVFIFQKIAVFIELVFFILFVVGVFLVVFILFLVEVIGNGVQRHGMGLRNFHLAFTFRAAQNFSLFHFVFVHIDFSGTFRTAEHVSILRFEFQPAELENPETANRRIIDPARESNGGTHSPAIQCNSTSAMKE